jgi:hypothetical protein
MNRGDIATVRIEQQRLVERRWVPYHPVVRLLNTLYLFEMNRLEQRYERMGEMKQL